MMLAVVGQDLGGFGCGYVVDLNSHVRSFARCARCGDWVLDKRGRPTRNRVSYARLDIVLPVTLDSDFSVLRH
jgi:hypothetical protein